jgi:UDP-N-acetylmuramoyl-L-alanyl-D-glutamate--2,6-diaminopimelate ligase
MAADGVDVLVMEVSSHGLKLHRVDGIDFDMAVFTNLTRDHLDFHRTFEDYFDSKRMLFQNLGESRKKKRAGIINADDEYGKILLQESGRYPYPFVSLGLGRDADYRPVENSIRSDIDGIRYILERPEKGTEIRLGVTGRFQVYNSLCALAAAHRMRVPLEAILKGLASVENIPGRFDRVPSKTGFHVIVDYAHTNDALLKLLQSVRELSPGRIITVFGCGGNRDSTKRPLMGRVAADNSDRVIVTSDNPRGEDPGAIIRDIVADLKASNFEIIADREEAIRKAIGMAEKNDIVVIAGKGHEDYQIIGDKKSHFDDREMARKYIAVREGA